MAERWNECSPQKYPPQYSPAVPLYTFQSMDYECEICNGTFSTASNLLRHKIQKHSNIVVQYPCEKCGKNFPRKDNCERHAATCQGIIDKVNIHQCELCLKKFPTKSNWSRHVGSCNGPEAGPSNQKVLHSCEKCKNVFTRKDNLLRHVPALLVMCAGNSLED